MPPRQVRAIVAIALVATFARGAHAQGWPEGAVVFTAGITSLDNRGAPAAMAGITRSYGPIVLGGFGEMIINGATTRGGGATIDPLNGRLVCANGRPASSSASCLASYDILGGALVEAGLSLDPILPLVISRGYRLSPIGESYFAATLHDAMRPNNSLGWMVRVSVGKRTAQVHAGVRVTLGGLVL